MAYHNQRKMCTGRGLEAVQVTEEQYAELKDPYSWRCDHLTSDQGPDMKCAKWFLQSGVARCNVDDEDDLAHGCHNDFNNCDKHCGSWAFRRLQRLARGAIYGPFDENRRYRELKDIVEEIKSYVDPSRCPVFTEALPRILQEQGQEARTFEADIEATVWRNFGKAGFLHIAGSAGSPARWLCDHNNSEIEQCQFSSRAVAFTYAAMVRHNTNESKMGLTLKMLTESGPTFVPAGRRTHGKTDFDKVKNNTKDQVEIGALFYSNIENKFTDLITYEVRHPWALWHRENNRLLRSVENVIEWELKQIKGNVRDVIVQSMRVLQSGPGMLSHLGFDASRSSDAIGFDVGHPVV